jgi:hypothetical protein
LCRADSVDNVARACEELGLKPKNREESRGIDPDGIANIEADHFGNYPVCGAYIDMHDLAQMALVLAVHRVVLNSTISFEYFRNMAIRLLVKSVMTLRNSTGDLIVASLWANSKENCMLACAISSSFA